MTYRVTVGFSGFIGTEEEVDVIAPRDASEAELESIIQDDVGLITELLDIEEDDVISLGDGGWEVPVSFAGYLGTETLYTVYAESLDEAIDVAYEDAAMHITILDYVIIDDTEDGSGDAYNDIHSEEWYIARDHGEDTDFYM